MSACSEKSKKNGAGRKKNAGSRNSAGSDFQKAEALFSESRQISFL
jgi:hypothetical protein